MSNDASRIFALYDLAGQIAMRLATWAVVGNAAALVLCLNVVLDHTVCDARPIKVVFVLLALALALGVAGNAASALTVQRFAQASNQMVSNNVSQAAPLLLESANWQRASFAMIALSYLGLALAIGSAIWNAPFTGMLCAR